MKYAYPLKPSWLDREQQRTHVWDLVSKWRGEIVKGIHRKDYSEPMPLKVLGQEMQDWLKGFDVDYKLVSYSMQNNGSTNNVIHFIQFSDEQTRLLFKLTWGGK